MKVGCIGEAMGELALSADAKSARVGVAGDTFNTAIYLAREAGGALAVDYVTRLGRDAFSARILAQLSDEGIGTGRIAISPDRNAGLYAIETDDRGERRFTYWRDRSAARELFSDGFAALDGLQVAMLSAITLAILPPAVRARLLDELAARRAQGLTVAFDSNYRPALWESPEAARDWIGRLWQITDIGLPSVDDEAAIFGSSGEAEVIARLHGWGVRRGALKRGGQGPLPLDGSAAGPFPPAARVVDTTAAGDSFNGGFLAALLRGADTATACAAGHALASRVIGAPGAILPRDEHG